MHGPILHPTGSNTAGGGPSPFTECKLNTPRLRESSPLGETVEIWQELERDVAAFLAASGWVDFTTLSVKGVSLPPEVSEVMQDISVQVRSVMILYAEKVLGAPDATSRQLESRYDGLKGAICKRIPEYLDTIAKHIPSDEPAGEANRLLASARQGAKELDRVISADMGHRIERAKSREAIETELREVAGKVNGVIESHRESVERVLIDAIRPVEESSEGGLERIIANKLAALETLERSLAQFPDQEVSLDARRGAAHTRERYESLMGFLERLTITPMKAGEWWSVEAISQLATRLDVLSEEMSERDYRSIFGDAGKAKVAQSQLALEFKGTRGALLEKAAKIEELERKLAEFSDGDQK